MHNFSFKNVKFSSIGISREGEFPKLMICPYCRTHTDSKCTQNHFVPLNHNSGNSVFVLAQTCTACDRTFVTMYHIASKNSVPVFLCSCPAPGELIEVDATLAGCSSRFADLYLQAQNCYRQGYFDLAAMGFRTALECLVKDFAIKYKAAPEKDVSEMHLDKVIREYLHEPELENSADVIRMLGNDYAHYKRKYEKCDIETLVEYTDILCTLMQYKLRALSPPLKRKG